MKKDMIILFIIAIVMGMCTYFLLGKESMNFILSSSGFKSGDTIPAVYTCDGKNISPHLSWHGLNTDQIQSYALIVDDPDAQSVIGRTFVHWVVLLSPNTKELPEGISGNGISKVSSIDPDAIELVNDFNNTPYGGPCPPNGKHTYRFTLFALKSSVHDTQKALAHTVYTAEMFRANMERHIITETMISATYTRSH